LTGENGAGACQAGGDAGDAADHGADVFAGFWMGGFEGADHVNGAGVALDMVRATGHLDRLDEDHRRAAQAGVRCVRESIGWRVAESAGGHIDLTRALQIQASARRHGLQVLWTLMHYGLPGDLSLHDDAFVARLARFAAEVARVLGPGEARPPVYTPVNEIGFLAWAASQPDLLHAPNNTVLDGSEAALERSRVNGYVVKCRLVRAALAALAAMRAVDPRARFMHVEPVVHVVAPQAHPDLEALAAQADTVAGWQWQACDMLAGRLEPQLGGHAGALDLLGLNHYHTSQWEVGTGAQLDWFCRDPRRRPLGDLLATAWQRYGRPIILAETSHVGDGRAAWLHEVAGEVRRVRHAGVPVHGLCLYPLVDRPDWADPTQWHRSGVWHVDGATGPEGAEAGEQALQRVGEAPVLTALRQWQQVLPVCRRTRGGRGDDEEGRRPVLLAFTHLRWDFLRHRTRHLLQRLAGGRSGWRVIVVEEPLHAPTARLDVMPQGPHIEVWVPHTPSAADGFCGPPNGCLETCLQACLRTCLQTCQQTWLQALLKPRLLAHGITRPTVWLSTPLAWPLARSLRPARVVFDCADDMGAFLGAPPELAGLECGLLAAADLVLAAGPAMARTRAAAAGDRLKLLPNGVDLRAFARRRAVPGWAAWEAALLPAVAAGPQLGYVGAVDERMDFELLAALADARPQWQFVIVGPVLKVAADALPQRPNIQWSGAQPYTVLPALMARWRIALLPWRLCAATRHANPLKVIEALAAGLPVVAPPLCELQGRQRHGVHTATGLQGFLQACSAMLDEDAAARALRQRAGLRHARLNSWDVVAKSCALALREMCAGETGARPPTSARRDAPDDIAHVVGHQQGAAAVEGHAHRAAPGVALRADESSQHIQR